MNIFWILIVLIISGAGGCDRNEPTDDRKTTPTITEEIEIKQTYLRLDPVFKGIFKSLNGFNPPGQTFIGTLLAVDWITGEQRSFPWHLELRKDRYRAISLSIAELPEADYDIYLLIQNGTQQYIGTVKRIDPTKQVVVKLFPYIGRTLTDPLQIKDLLRFEVNYTKDKFTVPVNTDHTWLGIKEDDNEELFFRTELRSLYGTIRSFYWFGYFYVEKLPFPRKYEIRAYSVPPTSTPVQWGRVKSRIPSFINKEGKRLVREVEYELIPADYEYNYVRSWLQPLKIKVYYTREDFRKWAAQPGRDAIPVYMYLAHMKIKIIYILPTDIAEMMDSDGDIKLKGYIRYKKVGIQFQHTAGSTDKRRIKSVFFYSSPTVIQFSEIAEYIRLTVMDNKGGRIFGVCPRITVPKHKCKYDYHLPATQMCDYRSPELNCQIQIKRPSLNNYRYF